MAESGRSSAVERVLGGSPMGVFVRLLVMSFVVGLILHTMNVDPTDIVRWLQQRLRDLSELGLGSLETAFNILVLGAVIVVPVWLVFRAVRLIGR